MNPDYELNDPRTMNQPPVKNVGKTGFYIMLQGTIFRFPAHMTLPNGKVVDGQRLPHFQAHRIRAVRGLYKSKYAPGYVGKKQKAKLAKRKLQNERAQKMATMTPWEREEFRRKEAQAA